MKLRILVLSFLFPLVVFSQRKIDVLHYKFSITVSDTSNIIWGETSISIKALQDISTVELDFTKYTGGKGMNVLGIYKGKRDDNRLAFTPKAEKMKINLVDTINKDDTLLLTLFYWGIPKDGLIISKNKYGHRTFFADN